MVKIGIVGLGFMGRMHFKCYTALENAEITAVCDTYEKRLKESGVCGNYPGTENSLDFTGIELYTDFDKMLAEADLDAISITLPTYLHTEYTIKALNAGLNVLCEKPMAMTVEDAQKMADAAEKNDRILQIGHCIRFWPEYVKAKEIIDSQKYGHVIVADFQRLTVIPGWGAENWVLKREQSGGAMLDLHIHDTDFVQYVFGLPEAVLSTRRKSSIHANDYITTHYLYDNEAVITAEGGWILPSSLGFEMSFRIVFENATLTYSCKQQPTLKVYPADGDAYFPELLTGDGWLREIEHFTKKVGGESVPEIITPAQSIDAVKTIFAEEKSAGAQKAILLE